MLQNLTIDQSFQKLLTKLNPTEKQRQQIQVTRETIDSVLANDQRIFLHTQKQPSFLTGSYSRNTIIRPIHDIDLYARIHYDKHAKDKSPRSILLLMASALKKRYPNNTKVNVDSPCVVVGFSGWGYKFEVVPVVCYDNNSDLYDIPVPGSQSWMQCYPHVPTRWLSSCNHRNNKMFIPIIKILKQWNRNNKVGLKSFHLELRTEKVFGTVTEINSYPQGIFDWMYCVRNWVWDNNYPFIIEPGKNYEYVDEYMYEKPFRLRVIRNKFDTGLKKAERAWNFYVKGREAAAKRTWRQMFGSMFPVPQPPLAKPVFVPPKQLPAITLKNALSMQQPAGLLGGYQRNALLDALSNSFPKLANTSVSDMDMNALLDLLANSKGPFKR